MPFWAVRLERICVRRCAAGNASPCVFRRTYSFKVVRVDTKLILAEVVDMETFGDVADE